MSWEDFLCLRNLQYLILNAACNTSILPTLQPSCQHLRSSAKQAVDVSCFCHLDVKLFIGVHWSSFWLQPLLRVFPNVLELIKRDLRESHYIHIIILKCRSNTINNIYFCNITTILIMLIQLDSLISKNIHGYPHRASRPCHQTATSAKVKTFDISTLCDNSWKASGDVPGKPIGKRPGGLEGRNQPPLLECLETQPKTPPLNHSWFLGVLLSPKILLNLILLVGQMSIPALL